MWLEYTSAVNRKSLRRGLVLLAFPFLFTGKPTLSQNSSPLASSGYPVLPVPQQVTLTGKDFALDNHWSVELEGAVKENDVAVESLRAALGSRFHLAIAGTARGRSASGAIQLSLRPNSLSIGQATDRNTAALVEQAYRLTLSPKGVKVTASAAPGLFYGVETRSPETRNSAGGVL
jgi:hexosaminidase